MPENYFAAARKASDSFCNFSLIFFASALLTSIGCADFAGESAYANFKHNSLCQRWSITSPTFAQAIVLIVLIVFKSVASMGPFY
jgi:hypothetical protein